jgi:hypothetical protein
MRLLLAGLLVVVLAACATPAASQVGGHGGPAAPIAAPIAATGCGPTPPRLRELVARLDADFDVLHSDVTPATEALGAEGRAGACAVVELLVAEAPSTRLHALRVLDAVHAAELGWRAGRGYPDQLSEDEDRRWHQGMSGPSEVLVATMAARRADLARWRRWLAQPAPGGGAAVGIAAALRRALDGVRPQLVACGEPLDVTATFDRGGAVTAISGAASTDASYRACLARAVAGVRGPGLYQASAWVRYPWP